MGLANPASNNAAIDQAPDKAASITGIRCMFRLAGGTISILVRRARAVPPVKPAGPPPASARGRPTAGAPAPAVFAGAGIAATPGLDCFWTCTKAAGFGISC